MVRRIFRLTIEGKGPYDIARILDVYKRQICTRAQAVTFLWRAAGSPKPETRTMPFADVPAGKMCIRDRCSWSLRRLCRYCAESSACRF